MATLSAENVETEKNAILENNSKMYTINGLHSM